MEHFNRKLECAQVSNKLGDCLSWTFSVVLAFRKLNILLLTTDIACTCTPYH